MIIRKRPNEAPEVIECDLSLESIQKELGGNIEVFHSDDFFIGLCDEEGKLKNLEPNLHQLGGDIIVGTILIVGNEKGEFGQLSEIGVKQILNQIVNLKEVVSMLKENFFGHDDKEKEMINISFSGGEQKGSFEAEEMILAVINNGSLKIHAMSTLHTRTMVALKLLEESFKEDPEFTQEMMIKDAIKRRDNAVGSIFDFRKARARRM